MTSEAGGAPEPAAGARRRQDPERVAILAPRGRDGEVIAGLLRSDQVVPQILSGLPGLVDALDRSGAAIVAEEALASSDLTPLVRKLEAQPDWSDFPLVVITLRGGGEERNPVAFRQMRALGNVTFVERPFHPTTLVSLVRTALASRRRQYQARDRLAALEASRERLARSDARLTFALAAGRLGEWEIDLTTLELTCSALCKDQFGRAADAPFGYDDFLQAIDPRDRHGRRAAVDRAIAAGEDYEVEYRITIPGGETRWIEVRGRAQYENGRAARMAGVSLDVTARKEAEERQQLLIRELHHRVKNTLSTVQAVVGSTARGARSVEEFYQDFSKRIMSLARTHTLLTDEPWQRANLRELLAQELGPYQDEGSERVGLVGPEVELPSDFAVPLGMAFHELATNAAKYGALSVPTGRVVVRWSLEDDPPDGIREPLPRLRLSWAEAGGPPVPEPSRQGFGTRLIDRVLTAQLRADVGIRYDPEGVNVEIAFPLPPHPTGGPAQW